MPNDQNNQSLTTAPQRHLALQRPSSLVQRGLAALATLERTMRFPEDREVGWLEFDGKSVEAKGEVRVPRTSFVKLRCNYDNSEKDGVEILVFLEKLEAGDIQELFLNCSRDLNLIYLKKLQGLKSLDVNYNIINNVGLMYISRLKNLTSLSINIKNTSDGLKYLAELPLTTLSIKCSSEYDDGFLEFTDSGFAYLAQLKNLTTLNLSGEIKDSTLAYLGNLANLTNLKINTHNGNECDGVTDDGLKYLAKIPRLTSLEILNCPNIKDLKNLANSPELTILDVMDCENIIDVGLTHLSKLSKLTSFTFTPGYIYISDNWLVNFPKLPQLTSLTIYGSLDEMQYSYGMGGDGMDAGLAYLAAMLPQLTSLTLCARQDITDAGLAHLVKMPKLKCLDIQLCGQITDAGLAHLSKLPKRVSISLDGCNKITDTGLAHFYASRK